MNKLTAWVLIVLLLLPAPVWAGAGTCSIFRSWSTGDSLTASDLTSSFTTTGQTNMDPPCIGSYSDSAGEMNTTTNPNSSGSGSLATDLSGEIARLRYAAGHVFGFMDAGQWWQNYQDVNFGNRMVRSHLTTVTDFRQMFRSEVHLSSASTRFHLFSLSTTEYVPGAAHPESLFILAHVNGTTRFQVDITGNVHIGGVLNVHTTGTAAHAAIFRNGNPNRGLFFPTPDSVAFTSGGEVLRVHAQGLGFGADNSFDIGNQFGGRPRHLHLAGRLNLSDGVVGQPSLTFSTQSTTGVYADSSTTFTVAVGGTATTRFNNDGLTLRDNSLVAWATGDPTATSRDVILSRPNTTALAVGMSSANTEVARFHLGGLMAGVNNSADIGTVSGSQFRHLHLAGDLTVTGSVHIGGIRGARGTWNSRGQFSRVGDHASAYVFNLTAHAVTLMGAINHATTVIAAPGAVSADIRSTGPVVGGRDQAAEFSANSWVHFYWIGDGSTSTIQALASAQPPTTGPNLPHGYVSWSYAGAIRHTSVGMLGTHIMGSWAYYTHSNSASVLPSGTATTATVVDTASSVPPNALAAQLNASASVTSSGSGAASSQLFIYVISSTVVYANIAGAQAGAASQTAIGVGSLVIPNLSQRFFYKGEDGGFVSSRLFVINVASYQLPSGGD